MGLLKSPTFRQRFRQRWRFFCKLVAITIPKCYTWVKVKKGERGVVKMAVSDEKKRIMISLTNAQNEELEKMAKKRGFTKSAIVALALEEYKKGQK